MRKYFVLACILISHSSYAQQDGFSANFSSLLLFPFLFILMYFLLIRPQAKKTKEHKDLIKSLKINDEIVTQCGILGKVLKLTEHFAVITIDENVNIIIKKDFIVDYLPKGTLKQIR